MQDFTQAITYHTLLQERQGRGFSEAEVTEILRQVLPQLAQFHSQGQVRGVISPETLEQNPATRQVILSPVNGLTPLGYTAPEQLQTGIETVASDIYSLGVTAIVLLSGKNPKQLRNYDGTLNWQDYCVVSDQLVTVVERAISPQPQYRYGSAMQMLQVLNTPPAPIAPKPLPLPYPTVAAPVGVYQLSPEFEPNLFDRSSQSQRKLFSRKVSLISTSLTMAAIFVCFYIWNISYPRPILNEVSTQKTNKEWHNTKLIKTLDDHDDAVNSVAVTSDGQKIISGSKDNIIKIWDIDKSTSLETRSGWLSWENLDTNQPVEIVEKISISESQSDFQRSIYSVKISSDNQFLAVATTNQIHLWNITTGKWMYTMDFYGGKKSISISPDSKTMVIGKQLINLKSGALICEFSELSCHKSKEKFIIINSKGEIFDESFNKLVIHQCCNRLKYLALLDANGNIKDPEGNSVVNPNCQQQFRCVQSDQTIFPINGYQTINVDANNGFWSTPGATSSWGIIDSSTMSYDGRILVVGDEDNRLNIWDLENRKIFQSIALNQEANTFAISPNNKILAVALNNKNIVVYDLTTAKKIGKVNKTLFRNRHQEQVTALSFSKDGYFLASGSLDRTVKIWDLRTGELVRTLSDHTGEIKDIIFTPDGKHLISASSDRTIKIWE
jgi:WD40 repeat protein